MHKVRPLSVSIIAWFSVVTGVLQLLQTAVTSTPPAVGTVLGTFGAVNTGLQIISGLWMLKGDRHARTLFAATLVAATLVVASILTLVGQFGLILLVLLYAGTLLYFLYRPSASAFFSKRA
ncbi:hypothetical protein BVER_06339c [Candidatus Burkholderia verschuerenii]|uniref:Uncharacterized protein n=1 Tax=Candidatus Burkholderia verschuerenii TaxID=242163 RepID=A0A0L0M7I1_9BURK|nr:hypothetical protein [Candidatus Burkholderia verschuerenii]KND58592.1 hypothetical protein BVER_06339c [Candidatus Burkholderia verschuerenii]